MLGRSVAYVTAQAGPGALFADEVVDIFLPVRFYWVRRGRWLKLHPEHPEAKATQPLLPVGITIGTGD